MMWRIIAGIGGLLIVFSAITVMPPTRVMAAETGGGLTPSETESLNQALKSLQTTLVLLKERLASLNLSADQAKQFNAALTGIRSRLVALGENLKVGGLASAGPKEVGAIKTPALTVSGVQSESAEKPSVTVLEDESVGALTAPDDETVGALAETEEVTRGSNWKTVFWIVMVALVAGWVAYSKIWKKKVTPQTQPQPTPTAEL